MSNLKLSPDEVVQLVRSLNLAQLRKQLEVDFVTSPERFAIVVAFLKDVSRQSLSK